MEQESLLPKRNDSESINEYNRRVSAKPLSARDFIGPSVSLAAAVTFFILYLKFHDDINEFGQLSLIGLTAIFGIIGTCSFSCNAATFLCCNESQEHQNHSSANSLGESSHLVNSSLFASKNVGGEEASSMEQTMLRQTP